MAKIRLELDALEVESFATETPVGARGTVHGNRPPGPTEYEGCETQGCEGGGTDFMDCDATVHYSCYHTCLLIDTCAQPSACTNCQGGVTWFCY